MNLKTLFSATAVILCCQISISQSKANVPERSKIDVNKDVDISLVYEQVIEEGYGTAFIYKKLANAYYFENNYELAKKYYEILFEEEEPDEVLEVRYRQTLKAIKAKSKSIATSGNN